jgi:DNA-binding CsgD family transcriptional regulator
MCQTILLVTRSSTFAPGLRQDVQGIATAWHLTFAEIAHPSQVRARLPQTATILVSTSDDRDLLRAALPSPMPVPLILVARTFVLGLELARDPCVTGILMSGPGSHLLPLAHAIQEVGAGRRYVQPELLHPLDAYLSEREAEVLTLTALGYRRPAIAEELGVGLTTVKTYEKRVRQKLGLPSLTIRGAQEALERWWVHHQVSQPPHGQGVLRQREVAMG